MSLMVVLWTKLSHLLQDGMAMIPQMPMLAGAILLETTSTKSPTSLPVEWLPWRDIPMCFSTVQSKSQMGRLKQYGIQEKTLLLEFQQKESPCTIRERQSTLA